jgi:hypothetical protein
MQIAGRTRVFLLGACRPVALARDLDARFVVNDKPHVAIRSRVKLALDSSSVPLSHPNITRRAGPLLRSSLRLGADQLAVLDDSSGHAQKKPMSILGA